MKRGKPLERVGRRAKREQAARDEMTAEVLAETGGVCVAKGLMPDVRCYGPICVHEVIDRSVRPGVALDKEFGVPTCWGHNSAINDDATRAREVGLSFYSWQVDEARARAAFLRRNAR